jgi:hypothetical protein
VVNDTADRRTKLVLARNSSSHVPNGPFRADAQQLAFNRRKPEEALVIACQRPQVTIELRTLLVLRLAMVYRRTSSLLSSTIA